MEKDVVKQHIQQMYSNWLKRCKNICAKRNLENEAEDILHEVLYDVLTSKNFSVAELCEKQEHNYKAIDCMIVNIINRYATSPTAPYHQHYHKNNPPVNRNINLNELCLPDDLYEPTLPEKIENVLNCLPLSEMKRRIFYFYYFENHKLSDWPGPQSISVLSRICTEIVHLIRKELKINYKKSS